MPPDDPSNPTVNFHGEKRSNRTPQSTTDPEARLCRKSQGNEAKLAYLGHILIENRNGLVVKPCLTLEWKTALKMIRESLGSQHITVGANKNYDTGSG